MFQNAPHNLIIEKERERDLEREGEREREREGWRESDETKSVGKSVFHVNARKRP